MTSDKKEENGEKGKEKKMKKEHVTEFKITDEHKWAVGFIEAEGEIGFNRGGAGTEEWKFMIKVVVKNTNRRAIARLKKIIGVGKVFEDKAGAVVYRVTDRKHIESGIYPILDNYPPRGVKYYEYQILKKGMEVAKDPFKTAAEKSKILAELKEESKKSKQVTPVVSSRPMD